MDDGDRTQKRSEGLQSQEIQNAQPIGRAAVRDGFLTRLEGPELEGREEELGEESDGGSGKPARVWCLYGRPARNSRWDAGIHAFTSTDLAHWSDQGQILAAKDVEWDRTPLYRRVLSRPAALRYQGRTYLFFEEDERIGVAWSRSSFGPFIVRRTPLLNPHRWGKASDPSILSLPVSIDEFGQIEEADPHDAHDENGEQAARTDWLVWASVHSATLCTLGKDRMELAFGIHRSRVTRWAPQSGQAVRSPHVVRLGGTFFLLWIDESHAIRYTSAGHLGGPWHKQAQPLTMASNGRAERLSVVAGTSMKKGSQTPSQGTLTISDDQSTRLLRLTAHGDRLSI